MFGWILFIIIIIILIWYYTRSNTSSSPDQMPVRFDAMHISSESPQAVEYGVELTYPQAQVKLSNLGIPQAVIESSQPTIQANLKIINDLNKKSMEQKQQDPNSNPPLFGINPNIIYTSEEFLSKNTGYQYLELQRVKGINQPSIPVVVKPSDIKPKVQISELPMYQQGQCGCCWAVSASNIFNYQFNKNKQAKLTYPEYFVYCLQKLIPNQQVFGGKDGCSGGFPAFAFEGTSISDQQGPGLVLANNTNNTYTVNQQRRNCDINQLKLENNTISTDKFQINGYIGLVKDNNKNFLMTISKDFVQPTGDFFNPSNPNSNNAISPDNLKTLVSQIKYLLSVNGPLVVCIDAKNSNLNNYSGGPLPLPDTEADHAVLLVGYNEDNWIIQNSWGAGWGATIDPTSTRKGYFFAPINNSCLTGICGIVYSDSPLKI